VVVIFLLLAVLAFFGCLVVATRGLVLIGLGAVKRRRAPAVRGLGLVCGAFGVGGYALGAVLVMMEQSEASHGADSSPARVCRQANPEMVTGHRAGYFPLRFDCELADGTTRSAGVVSGWLTPMAVVLTAAGVGLSAAAKRSTPVR
jgi:hypothetical protein